MPSNYESIYPFISVGLILVTVIWFIFAIRAKVGWQRFIGVIAAGATAVIASGVWQPALLPWVWSIPQITVKLWLTAIVVVGFATAKAFKYPAPHKLPIVICGIIALAINAWAVIVFFWVATVSAGGV